MQHNIEDKDKLATLEAAWKQVEEKSNDALKSAVIETLNNILPENIQVLSVKDDEKEVEKDDIDVDSETGRATGGAWTEIEVRKIASLDINLASEVANKLQEFDPAEIDNMVQKLISEGLSHENEILPFIQKVESVANLHFEDLYDYEGYDKAENNILLSLITDVDDSESREATSERNDAEAERKDPYGYRGLSRSDFI